MTMNDQQTRVDAAAAAVGAALTDATNAPDHVPTDMPTQNRPANDGASMNDDTSRLDGIAKVTGRAKYGRDYYPENALFVSFVRCPWGSATLRSLDEEAARNVDGVVEVVRTGDEGRYHGHPVGYIVAESKTALRRGMRAANPQWGLARDVRTTIEDSAGEAPPADDEVERQLQQADHIVEAMYSTPVQTHTALETHGVVVIPEGDHTVVYASTQGTFSVRDGLTRALDVPRSQVEVRCEYIGGGFGAKFGPGKEGMIAAEVAKRHNRPVSLFVDRDEEHLDTGNRPSSRTWVKIGIDRNGNIVGGQIRTWGGVGVADGGGGVRFPSGRYLAFEQLQKQHDDVSFNGGAPRAMRAPGHPQGAFTEELVIDELAAGIDLDPLALRLRLDEDDDRKAMYQLGAEMIGWDQRQQNGAQTGVVRRGFGMGSTSWGSRATPAEAEVVIHRDGSVETRSGSQDIGTGFRTIAAVLAAEQLGVPLHIIESKVGDSDLPYGPASGGSVTSPSVAPAMIAAAIDARRRLLTIIADGEGADASEFSIEDGYIHRNGSQLMSFADACSRIPGDNVTGRGETNRETRRAHWHDGHSHGAQFVDLEVDTESGIIRVNNIIAIQACGRVISRKTAESQVIGGVIQGLCYALFEDKLLDRNTGAMVNPNMEWYRIAGSADMPRIQPVLWQRNQTGVRSLGEPPVIPTAGAIACALYNAIGTPVRHLPLTPDKVLAAVDSINRNGGGS